MKTYDLAVAYRIYPKISKKPFLFQNDKYQLSRLCLKTFKEALGSKLKVKIYALMDSCPEEYFELFRTHFAAADLVFLPLDQMGNTATFAKQLEILSTQKEAPLVYLAEDDYAYLPESFDKMISFLTNPPAGTSVDFITPYDHLDYYHLDLHKTADYQMRFHAGTHWRSVATTCLTFLTSQKTLKDTIKTFQLYHQKKMTDAALWLSLSKTNIFNLPKILGHYPRRWDAFTFYFKAWQLNFQQIFLGKKYHLWTAIPSFSTHMESTDLAPGLDWEKILAQKTAIS